MAWSVRAVLFAELNRDRSQRIPIPRVESYSIDSAMDTDADSFQIEIGDPYAELIQLLERDNEVRVNLFGGTSGNLEELQLGFADTVGYTENGTMVISGRDLSCIATDSMAKPHEQRNYRPHKAIEKEARSLGFSNFKLDKVPALRKHYTDGSETYWEKWYRAYRKRGRWLWLEPNGTLKADVLHYTHKPNYRFGVPRNASNKGQWIPVQTVEFVSRKQGRVGVAYVIGEANSIGIFEQAVDTTIRDWVRRPLQIFQTADINSRKEARKQAFEEIFEAKVGAIEIVITVMHPGFVIRQNTMARLRLPQLDIDGEYFVVGNRIVGSADGITQIVRLRQKGFALTRRVPDDPKLDQPPKSKVTGAMDLSGTRWGDHFVRAAREHHGPWPFDLFLATLLAICRKETNFRNVRYSGTVEWYPIPGSGSRGGTGADPGGAAPGGGTGGGGGSAAIRRHRELFANSRTNPLNPLYPRSEAAVGPMQLVTPAYKVQADQYGGKKGEYDGGRWIPEANIRAAAKAFRGKLSGLPVSEANIFFAAGHRYYGSGSHAANQAYSRAIRDYVLKDPGYLGIVRDALQSAQDDLGTAGGGSWGGTKKIADQFRDVALQKHSLGVVSAKRDTRNTTTGGISDHWTGCKECYAYDLSNGSRPTPQMDACAREFVRMCGGSYNGRSELVFSKVIDGYRIQILYRTQVGGNHNDHIHVGVRKV